MKSKFKAIIVDDEKLARFDIKDVVNSFNEIEIIGEATSVKSAERLIKTLNPDLVFLDIQLRGETGFDLLDKIDKDINIVFITAYDSFAIRAFDVNAIDYLLKPITAERLKQMIDKLNQRIPTESNNLRALNYDDVIFFIVNNKYKFLRINTVIAITSDADYTYIYLLDKSRIITRKTMKEWESRLPDNYFCRIHRETIINISYISKIDRVSAGSYKVYLKGLDKGFSMSRRYVAKIKEKFI